MGAILDVATGCVNCKKCVKECSFLQQNGTPGELSRQFLAGDSRGEGQLHLSFSCNLCRLCETVCPVNLKCSQSFLEMRRKTQEKVDNGFNEHKKICSYEKLGSSAFLSLHSYETNSNVIFFPGCTLAATRSATTEKTYSYLQSVLGSVGIVLDCCGKPSHDLGRQENFTERFSALVAKFQENGVKKIITACPSCYITFKQYAPQIHVSMVYEVLANDPPLNNSEFRDDYIIHDACTVRGDGFIHDSVRELTRACKLQVDEVVHSKDKALCCGEGASASFVAPELTSKWQDKRNAEAKGKKVITYCAGCSSTFGKNVPNVHLLDALFSPERASQGQEKVTRSPFTYVNRVRLKRRLIKRQRLTDSGQKNENRQSKGIKIGLLILLLATIAGLRLAGIEKYFDPDELDHLLILCQSLPPALYIIILMLVPVFFLPTFPAVVAGGVLYGPLWGLIYAVVGATMGGGASFLISRYIANDWVSSRFSGAKWDRLQESIKSNGWKVVIVLRLVPLFPFTPLNYGLGLTKVSFRHYIVATFFGIMPACAIFIGFSKSLWGLMFGDFFTNILLFTCLFLLMFSTPFLVKKFELKKVLHNKN